MGAVMGMLSWDSLDRRAAKDNLRIERGRHGITIYSTALIASPMVSMQVHDLEPVDEDRVLLAMTDRALTALAKLH